MYQNYALSCKVCRPPGSICNCRLCQGSVIPQHWNLLHCPHFWYYIPTAAPAEADIPPSVCKVCLSTQGIAPACHTKPLRPMLKKAICLKTGVNWLICKKCPIHIDRHAWMKVHHEPSLGKINLKRMEKEFLQRGLSKLFLTSGANATNLERFR